MGPIFEQSGPAVKGVQTETPLDDFCSTVAHEDNPDMGYKVEVHYVVIGAALFSDSKVFGRCEEIYMCVTSVEGHW